VMKRKPRDAKAGIFSGGMGFDVVYQGFMVAVLVLISYFIGHYINEGEFSFANSDHGTTMAFLTMSMAEIFHSLNMRSQRGSIFTLKTANVVLWAAAAGSLLLTTLVCEISFLANAFGFVAVDLKEYLIAIGLGACVIPIVEIVKLIQRAIAKAKAKAE